MDRQAITGAVISTDPQFRAVFHPNGDGQPSPVEVSFEILVPFVEISHGHLEELKVVGPDMVFLDLEEDPLLGCKLAQFLSEATPHVRIIAAGTQRSATFHSKRGGITPMTVRGSPSSMSVRPTTPGSEPNTVTQAR